jgi:hypothetical protein
MPSRPARTVLRAASSGLFGVPACGAIKTHGLAGPAVAFSNEQHRRRYAEDRKHREEKLAASRAYRAAHRERLNAERRDKWRSDADLRARHGGARLTRNYGLSRDEHRRLLKAQNGVCAVCKLPSRRTLCVDHCHATLQVRGLLCDKCNTALGLFGDDSKRMRAAAAYVDRARRQSRSVGGPAELLAGLIHVPPRTAAARPVPAQITQSPTSQPPKRRRMDRRCRSNRDR